MAQASEIMKWVSNIFDANDINYDSDPEKNVIRASFPLKCKLDGFNAIIAFRNDCFIVNATLSNYASADVRSKVAEYITRANYGLVFGNFEMDFSDGEVRYRFTVDCEDRSSVSESLVMGSLVVPVRMLEKYGDGLLAVMYGGTSPEAAIEKAEAQ